jgi:hypothetical protein
MNTPMRCDECHLFPTHDLGTMCADCEDAAYAPANIHNPFETESAWIHENLERIEAESRLHQWLMEA